MSMSTSVVLYVLVVVMIASQFEDEKQDILELHSKAKSESSNLSSQKVEGGRREDHACPDVK
eukprot:1645101-Amphidinium_carterae.1